MNKRTFCLIIVFCLFVNHGSSMDKMRIAVMNFKGKGVSKTLANAVSDMIRTEMINRGKYLVTERSQMAMIIKEQGFQKTGCTNTICAVQIGKLLSARKMLVGTISKLGRKIVINGRIVDIEKGVGEFGETASAKYIDDLHSAAKRFARNLSSRIEGNRSGEDRTAANKTGDIKTIGKIEFVYIKGGEFMMGSPDGEGDEDEYPRHKVYVSGFWIGKYEVTQSQYSEIMGKNPSRFKGRNKPVEKVNWNNATDFCKRISKKYRIKVRLPYEAEWEYAARAGTTTKYYWGNKIDEKYCWYVGNSGEKTHPVGRKLPNKWGLYDMSGNVYEWCRDWYSKDSSGRSRYKNPIGPDNGKSRVLRGGSWYRNASNVRSSNRNRNFPGNRVDINGFRVVLSDMR